jgi:hypothetical protein
VALREANVTSIPTPAPKRRAVDVLKACACVLFAGHMAATCTQQIPPGSALTPLARPFAHYEELTGIWQSWNMFTTAPYFHGYRVDLDVTGPGGKRSTAGVMVPGLLPYDGTLRAESMLTCVLGDASCFRYLPGYVQQVCRELRARDGRGGHKLVFHESYERLRLLPDIRATGVISNHEDHRSKSFDCED